MTDTETDTLSVVKKDSNLSKSQSLLLGLKLLAQSSSLHLDEPPLNVEIRNLETMMMRDTGALEQAEGSQQVRERFINQLHDVDDILDRYHNDKSLLIQVLLDIQAKLHWLPKSVLIWVSEKLEVPLAEIYNIVTFYTAFSLVPQGRHTVRVCLGTTCHVQGASTILDRIEQELDIKPGETTPDQKFTLQTVNCLGCCALGPVIVVDDEYHGKLASTGIKEIFSKYE